MTVTATITRSTRLGNETPLQGAQSILAELGQMINAPIPAATDDHPVVIGGFAKQDLRALLLTANRDCIAKMYGLNFPGMAIEDFTAPGDLVVADTPGEFTIAGDLTGWLFPGDLLFIVGATTQQHDGVATVMETAFAAGLTTIGVSKDLVVILAAAVEVFDVIEAGVAATLCWKFEPLGPEIVLLGAAGNEFFAPGAPGVIMTDGDYSWLQAGDQILVQNATTHTNDQIYTVVTATYLAPDTTITVVEALVAEPAAANTTFQWVRTHMCARIAANEPVMWGVQDGDAADSSGVPAPILEDITTLMVSNLDATLGADFQARIVTVAP